MINRGKKKFLFWMMWAGLVAVYFVIKYQSPHWIELLFQRGALGLFDLIIHDAKTHTLDYYLGRVHELVFGPLEMVVSGLALLLICRRYLKNANGLVFGAAIFAYLLITKWEVLFFPPYGEAGAGPLAEAIWLYRHHFDYVGLFHQASYSDGGPKVYLFSIYPGFIALLLTLMPTVAGFIFIYHVLMLMAAATVVALFGGILLKIYDREIAMLLSLILLALPLFQSMTEFIDMEMMCLFFAVAAVYFLADKRIALAGIMAIMSSAVKAPGSITCAAIFTAGVGLFLFDAEFKKKPKVLLWSAVPLLFGFVKLYLVKTFVRYAPVPAGKIAFLIGWRPLLESKFLLLFLGLSLFGILWVWDTERNVKAQNNKPFCVRHFIPWVNIIFVLIWFAMYLNVSVMGPRYKLLLAPFLLFSVFFALFSLVTSERARRIILTAAILVSFWGSYGLFHLNPMRSYSYAFNELERSLEYRNDLKLDVLLAKTLQEEYPGYPVVAPFVIAQELAQPELGYVRQPLDVTIYGFNINYSGIKNFTGISSMDLSRTIWVGFEHEPSKPGLEYPIDSKMDKVVKKLKVGNKNITLFQGGYAVERMARVYQHFYPQIQEKLRPTPK